MMQRYFVEEAIGNEFVKIDGDDARHINRVMRMKPGDSIICCGTNGRCAVCNVLEVSAERITASVERFLQESNELPIAITIAQGLPKGDKLDLIVQKGTELGCSAFLPFEAERSVVKWDQKKKDKKTGRLQKIAKEAAEQAHRSYVPEVFFPASFQELLNRSNTFNFKIVAYEEEAKAGENRKLAATLQQINANDSLLVAIGPEGGLTNNEVTSLKDEGFIVCGLGPRILRTETAGFYLLAAISYQFELLR